MGIERLIAAFAEGDDTAIRSLDADEVRAVLDELDPLQRERERRIQVLATERRTARDGRADALRAEQDGMVADQRLGAEFRRAVKRRLAELTMDARDARIEVSRALATAVAVMLDEALAMSASLEADGLTDEEIDDHLSEIEAAARDLEGQVPGWRDLLG